MTLSRSFRRVSAFLFFLLWSTNSSLPQDTSTGIIKGRISVSRSDDVTGEILRGRSLNRYETSGELAGKPFDPYTLSEKAVVYIEFVPGSYRPPQAHPLLNQRDLVFRPLVLPVVVGTTVDFPNSDPLFHNVFSLSQPKEFDLGRYPKGQKKSVLFDKTGAVNVYCEIHSYMFATILVLQNPYFAAPSEDGDYTLPDIPPGTYQLSLWYGRKKVETKTVSVEAGRTATANFLY